MMKDRLYAQYNACQYPFDRDDIEKCGSIMESVKPADCTDFWFRRCLGSIPWTKSAFLSSSCRPGMIGLSEGPSTQ